MQIIKPILILCFVIVLIVVFRQRGPVPACAAGSRIAALLLGVSRDRLRDRTRHPADLWPTWSASSRGTDLILYILVVVFAVTSLGLYFRPARRRRSRSNSSARRVALSDAIAADGPPGRRDRADADSLGASHHLAGESTAAVQPPADPSFPERRDRRVTSPRRRLRRSVSERARRTRCRRRTARLVGGTGSWSSFSDLKSRARSEDSQIGVVGGTARGSASLAYPRSWGR